MGAFCLFATVQDLCLQLLDVGQELGTATLEKQVLIGEPGGVPETNELEDLWEQWKSVNGADNGVDNNNCNESSSGVDNSLWLVLDGVPLLSHSADDLVRVDLRLNDNARRTSILEREREREREREEEESDDGRERKKRFFREIKGHCNNTPTERRSPSVR